MIYMAIEGIILGVLALNEFVFIKSLQGTNYQLGFLFQFSMIIFLFLVFINAFLKRVRDRKILLQRTALLTRLPLLLVLFFPNHLEAILSQNIYHYIYLGLFLIYFSGNIIIYPNINYLLKTNYRHHNFGRLYSYATSFNKIIMLVITFLYGFLLDIDNYIFVYVIPLTGLLGVISGFVLASMYTRDEDHYIPRKSILQSVSDSIKEMATILKKNVPYRHFEIGFMLYGFSFMISVTVITIYFYEALNLNYSSVAFYRNSYNILAIVLLPFTGKLLGNIDPRKFASIAYASIGAYIFCLMSTSWIPYHFEFFGITVYYTLILYIIFHGVFAATMVLLWNIGSAYFCDPEDSGTYQSLHLSLTGARAIFAPLLGVFFYELFGFTATFSLAIASILIAIWLMRWSYKRDLKTV